MCDRVLASPYVFLHRQEPHLLPWRRHLGVCPLSVRCPPREPSHQPSRQLSRQPSRHLGLTPPLGLDHAGGDHPGLLSKEQHRLHHGLKKESGHPQRRPLPAEELLYILFWIWKLKEISIIILCVCCVCCWPPVSIPLPNYEVVGLQPQAVDITNLGSVHPPSKFQDPLRQICMPVTGQDKKRTENWHIYGHQCGRRDAPIT